MKRISKRALTTLLALVLLLSCTGFATAEEAELTTITLYPQNGNLTSGTVTGWLGDFFAGFGLRIEVWAYSDDKTNAILASGDLPDLMYVNENIYETMIQAGMLLNLEGYLEQMPNVMANEALPTALNYVREYRSAGTGELYFMPLTVGITDGSGDETERFALRLNWEFYEGIGAPEFDTIWDLIPVMKQMLETYPTGNPSGTNENKNYGTVLNSGSDTTYWGNIQMPYYWYGYVTDNLPYLLETNMIDATHESILEEDSMYREVLRWYNALYREGLIDPDSINLDRPTQKAKVDAGNVMVPSGTNPGWRPIYYQYLTEDNRLYYRDYNAYGAIGLGINANTANLEACLKFLDVIASPDNYLISRQGPEGEQWYFDENGHIRLTEKKIDSIQNNTTFLFSDGTEYLLWNTAWITSFGELTSYTDPDGNPIPVNMNGWKENQALSSTNPTYQKWHETNGGYDTFVEWADAEGKYWRTSPIQDVSKFVSIPDDLMQLTIDALRDIVVTASWQMVYAESDEAFEEIWDKMVSDCEGLGAQDIIDWRLEDLAAAKEKQDALAEE